MKYLLHIDTATDSGTVALAGDGNILSLRTNTESRNHAATINTMIEAVIEEGGCALQDIDAIAVCGGPGSYTGLRIGMATAKGLCYALNKPLIMADRLSLLAYNTWQKDNKQYTRYITLIRAREKEYFIAAYDADFNNIVTPHHIVEDQLPALIDKTESTYMITDEQDVIINSLEISKLKIDNNTSVDYSSWALYALDQFNRGKSVNLASAEPFYLKQVYTHK